MEVVMGTERARQAADTILDDLHGAGYYKDANILADFLRGRFALDQRGNAIEAAETILEDLRGAGYYRDPKILAEFLEGRFPVR
jgi:hypothetical protein